MSNAYDSLAKYYESIITDDYDGWGEFVLGLCKKYSTGKNGVDAACGTGYFTRLLAKNGYKVVGTDVNANMLAEAKRLSLAEGLNIEYLILDLTKFEGLKKLGFVTVINDGFNYLEPKKVKRAFKSIYSSLEKGGVLIFDISSEYKLRNVLGNQVYGEDGDDLTYIWFNTLYSDRVEMDLSFFERRGDVYVKSEESHVQYILSEEFIVKSLEECGYEILFKCGPLGEKLTPESQRITFVAKK